MADSFPSAPNAHQVRTLWLCGLLHGFTHLYNVALIPLYLPMQKQLGLSSVAQVTLLETVMMVAYFGPSYPMGVLADRLSRKQLLGWGLAVNAVGFIGLALAPNYGVALACAAVAGLGGSFYHPSATALIARLFPVNTGRALGLAGIGAGAGFFAGPLYAGWRASTAGWRAPVLELGVAGLVAAAVFLWLAVEQPQSHATGRLAESARRTPIFPTPALWLLFLAAACLLSLRDFSGSTMGSLGSLFLQKARGFDLRTTGLALSLLFIAATVSNPLFGHLSDRARLRWTAFVLVVAAGCMAVFPRVPRAWTIPALLAYGFFFMASYPIIEAALMQAVPDAVRGRVYGLFITVGGLLGNLAHWCAGMWVRRMGAAAAEPASYFGLYAGIGGLVLVSLAALPCLHALRQRGFPGRRYAGTGPAAAGQFDIC